MSELKADFDAMVKTNDKSLDLAEAMLHDLVKGTCLLRQDQDIEWAVRQAYRIGRMVGQGEGLMRSVDLLGKVTGVASE